MCKTLSARHLKELKDNIKLDVNGIVRELDSWTIGHYEQGHSPKVRAWERVRRLRSLISVQLAVPLQEVPLLTSCLKLSWCCQPYDGKVLVVLHVILNMLDV